MATLPGKLREHPHPSKDDGSFETKKNYIYKNIKKPNDKFHYI
jgi:hypothetical protein